MTNAILNPQFDTPVPSGASGEAENWSREAYQKNPGFAAFMQPYGYMKNVETFDFYDSPASVVGINKDSPVPFVLPASYQWQFLISLVVIAPTNVIRINGVDLRAALLPGTSMRVIGIPPNTELDGYWTVNYVELSGTDSLIHVDEDVLVVPPPGAVAEIPPVIACTPAEHAWQGSVTDTTAYPIAAIVPGQTIEVRINRVGPQTITFPGGETTAEDVAEVIDELLSGGGARVTDAGQVEIYSDLRGPDSSVQVLPITAGLVFPTEEGRGYGQWAQLWDIYFDNPAAALTPEVVDVFEQHWKHVRVSYPGGAAGDAVHVATSRKGPSATLFIDDTLGGIHDSAAWPIAARTPGVDDELNFDIGGTPVVVTLAVTDTTTDLVSDAISSAFEIAGVDAVCSASIDRVYVDSRIDLECTGGTANVDVGFPTGVVTYGGGTSARTIGLDGATDTGVMDVGWFDDFDSVTSVFAVFAEDSAVSANWETFTWWDILPDMEYAPHEDATFESWYGKLTADPTKWRTVEETFDDGWDNEWLSSYVATVPQAGVWKPPGVLPSAAIVGTELTFPLTLRTNANRLAIYSETDLTWYVLTLTGDVYDTMALLITELNTQLTASGMTDDVEFFAVGNAVALGWDGTAGGFGAFHLAKPSGIFADRDARPTLGLHPLASDVGAAMVYVPEGYYNGDPYASWDEDEQYGVDPWSRLVFTTAQDPDTSAWLAEANNDTLALFNTLKPLVTNTYAEQFSLGAWYGDYVAPDPYIAWPLASFDAGIGAEDFEDFEEGW